MAGGKWISDLEATTPIAEAARRVLTVRLEGVRECMAAALRAADQDPEHIHQLRVATRRSRAALDIFACCLPGKVASRGRKQLRTLRRAAGDARDWDVFLASALAWSRDHARKSRAGLDFLVGYVVAQRETAQGQLKDAGTGHPFTFDRLQAETVAAVHRPDDPNLRTLADLARPQLAALLGELEDAAGQNLDDYEHLHQVRILGKQLRYAMEVFADCFASAFREQLYPTVEEMQEVLGRANDSYVACGRLESLIGQLRTLAPQNWKRCRPVLDSYLQYHQARLPEERQRFLDWWHHWRRSGTAASFFAHLKAPADLDGAVVPLIVAPPASSESPAA